MSLAPALPRWSAFSYVLLALAAFNVSIAALGREWWVMNFTMGMGLLALFLWEVLE